MQLNINVDKTIHFSGFLFGIGMMIWNLGWSTQHNKIYSRPRCTSLRIYFFFRVSIRVRGFVHWLRSGLGLMVKDRIDFKS